MDGGRFTLHWCYKSSTPEEGSFKKQIFEDCLYFSVLIVFTSNQIVLFVEDVLLLSKQLDL